MKSWLKKIWVNNKSLVFLIFVMMCFRSTFADWNTVPTKSMNPTIVEGDRVFVNKMAYDIRVPFTGISMCRFGNPERGDIVTIESEAAILTLAKRVVGLPGDTIEMIENQLIINGTLVRQTILEQNENSLIIEENLNGVKHLIKVTSQPTKYSSFRAVKVPENMYLVLGDNRDNSADSRVHGFIPRHEFRGRIGLVVFSLNYEKFYCPRLARFFKDLI